MKILKNFFLVFISLFSFSMTDGTCFQQNTDLINTLRANHVRLFVLCNFQGTNNLLDIVTSSSSPGYALTNVGLHGVNDLIPLLVAQNITAIYTAPAFRALQITNLIGTGLGLKPAQLIVEPNLDMQNFGIAEGENYNIYKERFTSEQEMLETGAPQGEAGCSVFLRNQTFLQSIANQSDQTILVITHAFNFCYISKVLTGKYGQLPDPGTLIGYDYSCSSD